jgi:hypothetical protein
MTARAKTSTRFVEQAADERLSLSAWPIASTADPLSDVSEGWLPVGSLPPTRRYPRKQRSVRVISRFLNRHVLGRGP